MSDADTLGVLTMFLCLAGSMFFSGSETAITSFGEHHARRILEEGGRDAKVVRVWVREPVRVLSTILVGNNITNTLMGAVATALAIRHLGGGAYGEWAVPIAVFVTTGLLLVFGEILPKAIGRHYARRLAVPALTALGVLGKLLAPVTWLLAVVTRAMMPKEAAEAGGEPQKVTSDEIDYLVRVGQREGSIPADQAALLRGVFRFEDKIVRDIMVPRDQVTAIDLGWEPERTIATARKTGHSRVPVYEGDLDHIKGVLHVKSVIGYEGPQDNLVRRIMRQPMFVSESLLAHDLLQRFKEQRVHLAVVVDDGGHTVGVVTLEDVLEEIVGEIFDESDRAPPASIMPHPEGTYSLGGQESLTRVEELFGIEFDELEGVTSIGDLLTRLAGQIPIPGSVFVYEGVRFKVLAADPRHVIRVSAERIEMEDEDE